MSEQPKRVAFHTLGCKLNFAETSTIARQLAGEGFTRVPPSAPADLIVINTCSVTQSADRKCRQAIRRLRGQSPHALLAVVGCYAQLRPQEVAGLPGVDLVLGAAERGNLPAHIGQHSRRGGPQVHGCGADALQQFLPAYSSADRTRSYLKVQDGCSYRCAYCTIPLARGESRNIPIAQAVGLAQEIAARGIREVVITGVNTGDFGRTTGEPFIDLLRALEGVPGIERYRVSSIEPNLLDEPLIDFIIGSPRFAPHFHIPLQSGDNSILAAMGRRYTREQFAQRVQRIQAQAPNAFIGVDVIVGFPGERDAHFERTHQLLQALQPSSLHVFPYSPRPGTPAYHLPNPVPASTVSLRAETLQKLSVHLLRDFYARAVGTAQPVIFEAAHKGGDMFGFTGNYIRVRHPYIEALIGRVVPARILSVEPDASTARVELQAEPSP